MTKKGHENSVTQTRLEVEKLGLTESNKNKEENDNFVVVIDGPNNNNNNQKKKENKNKNNNNQSNNNNNNQQQTSNNDSSNTQMLHTIHTKMSAEFEASKRKLHGLYTTLDTFKVYSFFYIHMCIFFFLLFLFVIHFFF